MKKKTGIGRWVLMIVIVAAIVFGVVFTFQKIRSVRDTAILQEQLERQRKEEETAAVREGTNAAKVTSAPSVSVTPAVTKEAEPEKKADVKPTDEPHPTLPAVLTDLETVPAGTVLKESSIDSDNLRDYFQSYEISDALFERIYGDNKSYKSYCTVPREDLRYVKVLHRGFDDEIHVGELIIHRYLANEMCEIFRVLFENDYQIEKMLLIDNYFADDDASIADNNTSAFNFRLVTDGDTLSTHGMGCAIDINPRCNPYIWYDENGTVCWEDPDADKYLDRYAEDAAERHMINENDLCYQLFAAYGYTWGGYWSNPVDYQHFEKVVAYYTM